MVNGRSEPVTAEDALLADTTASLVNCGQDTQFTFRDGSTLILKGVTHPEAVFAADGSGGRGGPAGSPIGGEICGDGERAHRRRNGREGVTRVGE